MIHCILTQNKLKVEQSTDVLPFQFSSNINIKFVKDDTYKNYVVTPYYAWVPTKSILPRKIDAFAVPLNDGVFTLPMSAFVKDGFLAIAFSLTDGKEVLQTDPIYLAVQSSVGENDILPEDDSWQLVVIDTVNQYIELNINEKLQALIVEVARLNEESKNMQDEVNALVDKVNKMLEDGDFIPEHKWESTFLHFKNPNGEWDDGVNLKGDKGDKGDKGEEGKKGDKPSHEIDGTKIRFQNPDGTWGDWIELEVLTAEQVPTSDGSNVQMELNRLYDVGYLSATLSATFELSINIDWTQKIIFPFSSKDRELGNKFKLRSDGGMEVLESGVVEVYGNLSNAMGSITTGLIEINIYKNNDRLMRAYSTPVDMSTGYENINVYAIDKAIVGDVFYIKGGVGAYKPLSTNFHAASNIQVKFTPF